MGSVGAPVVFDLIGLVTTISPFDVLDFAFEHSDHRALEDDRRVRAVERLVALKGMGEELEYGILSRGNAGGELDSIAHWAGVGTSTPTMEPFVAIVIAAGFPLVGKDGERIAENGGGDFIGIACRITIWSGAVEVRIGEYIAITIVRPNSVDGQISGQG